MEPFRQHHPLIRHHNDGMMHGMINLQNSAVRQDFPPSTHRVLKATDVKTQRLTNAGHLPDTYLFDVNLSLANSEGFPHRIIFKYGKDWVQNMCQNHLPDWSLWPHTQYLFHSAVVCEHRCLQSEVASHPAHDRQPKNARIKRIITHPIDT